MHTQKHEFLHSADGKSLSEGYEEPLEVEFSFQQPVENVATRAAQVTIPDLWLGFHFLS